MTLKSQTPRTGRMWREDESIFNEADYLTRTVTQFDERRVAERTPTIELKSSFGISNLRDITSTAGSATITNSAGEYKLSNTANGADTATLDSAERGQYIPGAIAETGIGVRFPDTGTMTGNQLACWGYYDDNDGLLFGEDANGLFVGRRKGGTTTKTYQADWNGDKLDGTGPSELTLDPSNGYVYQIDFAWYGYGVIQFKVFLNDADNISEGVVLHRMKVDNEVSIENPNLPIRAEIDNAGTAQTLDLFVAGRQFSILGRNRPNRRVNGEFRELGSVGTTFLPVMSFRKKSNFTDVTANLFEIDAFSDADLRYQIRLNATLGSPSFGSLANTSTGETALEVDTSATSVSGGEVLEKGLLASAGGNKKSFTEQSFLNQAIPEDQPITLAVRTLSGTGATVQATMLIEEEW